MSDLEEPQETSGEEALGGNTAGAVLLTLASGGVGLAVFTYSRDAFVLLVWALGAIGVWWAAKKPVRDTPNPAPPPAPERGSDEEPQVILVKDPAHPNRWLAVHSSPWLAKDTSKETGTA
jgi:hypothetical protein